MSTYEVCDGGLGSLLLATSGSPSGAQVAVRERIGNALDPDGIVAEVARGAPPERRTPWTDRASRAWAVRQLERGPYPGMSEDQQREALEYVRGTPFYE